VVKKQNGSSKLQGRIEKLLTESKQDALTPNQILVALNLQKHERSILLAEIKKMLDSGRLVKTVRGRFGLPDRLGYVTGTLEGNRRGFAFLRPDLKIEDVFISASELKDAAHGDQVIVRVSEKKGRRRREGTVIKVLKRGQSEIIGTLQREKGRYLVIPDDRRFPGPVGLSRKDLKGARPGDKVLIQVLSWSGGAKAARGKLLERIGPAGSPQAEKAAFSHRFDLPGEFPPGVLKEAEILLGDEHKLEEQPSAQRRDLRSLQMVTIDDETARDFDDAVSLEALEEGRVRLGVHIADVSHYAREGRAIDREALKRGTSTYLPDRVIHMLPPTLSEDLCSLREKVDRLAVSVLMDIDAAGELVDYEIYPSRIAVTERLTYQQVESYLSGDRDAGLFREASLAPMLDKMEALAKVLRKRRMDRGALDLDMPEAKMILDEEGRAIGIEKRAMGRSESLIEEFMVYCNEAVASYLFKKKKPCIYRIHAVPTTEKLALLRETLSLMGIEIAGKKKELKPRQLKELLDRTRGDKKEKLVRYLVLRSLPQAIYSAANEGHFGLASPCYCHFTSPIRRYPDLVVHRVLKKQLQQGGLEGQKEKKYRDVLPNIAAHCSIRERAAMEAERTAVDMKKAEYMEEKIGETYKGIINGVTNFGIFVELENTVEGMIPLTDLTDDYYVLHERAAALVGERTRRTYRMGDEIEITVTRVNREEGKITFALAKS